MMAAILATVLASQPVFVRSKDSLGAGIVLADQLVLSVDHLYRKKGVYVGEDAFEYDKKRTKAKVICRSPELDLMLIQSEICSEQPVRFAMPQVGDEVSVVSWPYTHQRLEYHGRIAGIKFPYVYLDMNLSLGMSGGGVFNKRGELVGMISFKITDGMGGTVGGAIHVEAIRVFLRACDAL